MDIAARFARDTAQHEMTVLHDDGLYRHLRFQRTYWQPPLLKQQRSAGRELDGVIHDAYPEVARG